MSLSRSLRLSAVAGCGLIAGLQPGSVWACAACYGQSDSPMAAGMNWGILTLLGVIVCVLAGVAGFFVFLARRSAARAGEDLTWTESAPLAHERRRGLTGRTAGLAVPRKQCGHGHGQSHSSDPLVRSRF